MMEQDPSLQLAQIPADALRIVWPMIVDRIRDLSEEYGDGWLAEDVYVELSTNCAYLWGTENMAGFVVLVILTAPWGKDLNVWIADNETVENAAFYWPQLLQMARDNGCQRVVFESARKGFAKAIPDLQVRYRYFEVV
jgi:hypothetical protein